MKPFLTLCAILVAVVATTQAQHRPPEHTITTLGTTHAFLGQANVVTDLGTLP